ncbi:hypothetical protein H4Q26_017543 [Puccinia striiformis f. sp. tritici PST-130]|uniref:Retrotransposon gag domain-containing protein n=1 Tax=Puccinia striiformis f. sp. tritici PST-78 TaxID=1165861 RepID=A0A0L0V1R5_9BASI|nr:hypothetical protein H4Q26_017543 [Puccinia striiformis f. sp. tritici PST-130]KNE92939.1 hypothetical protein PSTG_13653 [Puccinia striiformis f. sp. tritici PST-78]
MFLNPRQIPAKTECGRSQRRRNADLTQNGDTDSDKDPPYEQAPEDPQGLISTLIRALNTRPTSDHGTPKIKTPGMKAPDCFDGKNSKKPDCILNNWDKFEQQLFTLFGDPNEIHNAEYELNNLQMKESSKASAYIAQLCTLPSRTSWNDTAFTFHFRKLINRTIKLDNCYHDKNRSKKPETSSKQEDSSKSNGNKYLKKPQQKSSNYSGTPALSSSKPRTRTTPKEISLVLCKEGFLKGNKRARQEKEGLCMHCGGKHDLDTCAKKVAVKQPKLPQKNRKQFSYSDLQRKLLYL